LSDSFERYLYVSGGFAVGGVLATDVPTTAAVHLPLSGGVSEAIGRSGFLDCRHLPFPGLRGDALKKAQARKILRFGKSAVVSRSVVPRARTRGSATTTYVSTLQGLIEAAKYEDMSFNAIGLSMQSSHDITASVFPDITVGKPSETFIDGLTIGGCELKVTFDLALLNALPTLEKLEEAFERDQDIRARLSKTFRLHDGQLYKSKSGFLQGSLVKKISGPLPEGAFIEEDGYTITWPGHGQYIVGQILIGAFLRRVTMLRVHSSDLEFFGGCSGGSTYP
jgi:hypothetical protein